ncbi:MAG: hypothetical protein JWN70_2187, partial [Planctomycetaceae bacterium]|nr:hypothetical protein [Planctomycetaceae bacterium]
KTMAQQVLTIDSAQGKRVVDAALNQLKASWQAPLNWN